jgi:hypothetical protein
VVSLIKTGEGIIPSPGHKSVASERQPDLGVGKLQLNEAAAAPAVKRTTLPYYRPPSRRRSSLELSVNEMMLPEVVTELAPPEAVLDVAVASFGETNVLEAIIGSDDRVRVADNLMIANPWRQICALRIRSKTGKMYVGTGWFIAPRVLATAGHCVFLQNEGGWAQSIDVIPAKAGSSEYSSQHPQLPNYIRTTQIGTHVIPAPGDVPFPFRFDVTQGSCFATDNRLFDSSPLASARATEYASSQTHGGLGLCVKTCIC